MCVSGTVWRNNAGENFTKVAEIGTSVAADFDNDGFVDLFSWSELRLFHNDRGDGFTEVELPKLPKSVSRGACWGDFDGDLDVYVSNYRLQPNLLWLNDGTGRFEDVAQDRGAVATSPGFGGGHSIGAAWGDFDNDGIVDLFAGNFAHVDNRGDQPK